MKTNPLIPLALVFFHLATIAPAEETNRNGTTKLAIDLNVDGVTNTRTTTFSNTESSKDFITSIATNFDRSLRDTSSSTPGRVAAALPFVRGAFQTNAFPAGIEMGEAADLLTDLKNKGMLPGVARDSHGRLAASKSITNNPSEAAAIEPPSDVTFHLVLSGDSLTNHYTVGRKAEGAPLQLLKAWRTDAQGGTATNWPVK
jgi:hypothetical protein